MLILLVLVNYITSILLIFTGTNVQDLINVDVNLGLHLGKI